MGMFFPHKGAVCYKQSFIYYTGFALLDKNEEAVKRMAQPPSASWTMAASHFRGEVPVTNACISQGACETLQPLNTQNSL